jgi:TRAP-type C4-dicarboxylate transport system substrate-binding protein
VQPFHICFGGYQPDASVHNRAAVALGRALGAHLGAAVRFDLDGNILASGDQAADLLAMVEGGGLTMCYFSASYLATRVPEFALLDLPFTITERQRAYQVLDGPLGRLLAENLHTRTGLRLLGWWDNGFRHLTDAVRPIRTPADCVSLRIRTLFGAAVLLCHRASYDTWPAEVQLAVEEVASEATAVQCRLAAAEDDDMVTKLRLAQNEIFRLTDAERALFVAAVVPVVEEQRQRFGDQPFSYVES